jgi:hypothetical protein
MTAVGRQTPIETYQTSGGAWTYRFVGDGWEWGGGAYATSKDAFIAGTARLAVTVSSHKKAHGRAETTAQ